MASAYSGFLLWHGGLSGSIPLSIATDNHMLIEEIGIVPVSETLFGGPNLFIVGTLLLTLPLLNRLLMKSARNVGKIDPELLNLQQKVMEKEEEEPETIKSVTPAERLENSRIISLLIGILGLAFVLYHFVSKGFDLNLNIVNFIFLFLGILFHGTPRRFLNSVTGAVKNAGGIIIQFPFYAGIMGMMTSSGLSEQLSMFFVNISNEVTLPWLRLY